MNRFRLAGILSVVILSVPLFVWAQESVIHPADRVHDGNYIRAGQSIQVLGHITKDAILVGRDIIVSGPIEGDVIIVGQNVVINSVIGGNVRVVGGTVSVDATVGKNLTIMAGSLSTSSKTKIAWDVMAYAEAVDLQGTVDGSVWVRSQNMNLGAVVAKDVDIDTGKPLTVSGSAQVKGTLQYSGQNQAAIAPEAAITNLQYRPTAKKDGAPPSGRPRLFWPLVFLFGAWVVGGVLLAVAEPWLNASSERIQQKPWVTLGWGVVGVTITPIVAVILAVTLIGIPLGVLLMMGYMALVYCARVIVGYSLARMIQARTHRPLPSIAVMVLGIGLYVVIINIPFAGPVLGLLGTTLAFGAVMQSLFKQA